MKINVSIWIFRRMCRSVGGNDSCMYSTWNFMCRRIIINIIIEDYYINVYCVLLLFLVVQQRSQVSQVNSLRWRQFDARARKR